MMEFDEDDLEMLGYGQERALEVTAAAISRLRAARITPYDRLSGAEKANRRRLTEEWRSRNPEKVRAAQLAYRRSEEGRERQNAARRAWRARNPDLAKEKDRARYARAAAKRKAARPERPQTPKSKYYETRKRWKDANAERVRAYAKAYYAAKRDTINARRKELQAAKKERKA